MENDFKNNPYNTPNRPYEPPEHSSRKGLWLSLAGVAAIALVAYFTLEKAPLTADPADATYSSSNSDYYASSPDAIEPAEGEAFTEKRANPTDGAAPVVTTAPVEPTAATAPNTYASEEECKSATNAPCHFVTCDSVPAGKQPDEACGADFKKGWQPVVPAMDSTNIPEEVAPPMTGQQKAPTEAPPMTGQQNEPVQHPPLMGQDPVDQMTAPPSTATP